MILGARTNKSTATWLMPALRLIKHETFRGELSIVFFAIVLAVATVFSLSGFSNYINNALALSSSNFIAADKVLKSPREIAPEIVVESKRIGLNDAKQVLTSSMVFAGDNMQLSSIKAVSALYPLRGELLIKDSLTQVAIAKNQPAQGEAWLEANLFTRLSLNIGDNIEIGMKTFTVTGLVESIPDASFSVFTSAPTAIINIDDLAATKLIQPASRVTYKYLFSGDSAALENFSTWLTPQLNETQRWYDIQSSQSPLARALERAEKYLSLASMLGVILAAVAVSVATKRYGDRNLVIVATLKALGAARNQIVKLYCFQWTLLCGVSIIIGMLVGYGLMLLGLQAVAEQLNVTAGSLDSYPFLVALLTGVSCAVAFALSPFQQLFNISALAVIRGVKPMMSFKLSIAGIYKIIIPTLVLLILLVIFSGDLLLSAALLAGGFVVCLILAVLANVLVSAGRSIGTKASSSWHLAIANLKRRANENVVQLISFTLAIKLLLLILVMKNALMEDWREQLPEQAANRFLINIAEHELTAVNQFINQHNIHSSDLYPVVRGRLVAVNDEQVRQEVSKEKREAADNGSGRAGVGRELNLTWKQTLPENNEVIAGSWWQGDEQAHLVSLEKNIAERLSIELGDRLSFTIGSLSVSATVSSIRDANWQSLQPNFFMIFNPKALSEQIATHIASMHIPPDKEQEFQQLLASHPTISILNVDAIINKLRVVIDQVSIAIGLVLILVLIAGSLVLVAQVQASMEERERELAILRTLGAKGALLKNSVLVEFITLGAIAGAMASIAMESAVYILQVYIFEMKASFHFEYWLLGIIFGASFVGLLGFISCRKLLKLNCVTLIRRTL